MCLRRAPQQAAGNGKKSFRSFRFVSFWDLGKHIMISGRKRNAKKMEKKLAS